MIEKFILRQHARLRADAQERVYIAGDLKRQLDDVEGEGDRKHRSMAALIAAADPRRAYYITGFGDDRVAKRGRENEDEVIE